MSEPGRKVVIIAGPNGAGKTTLAREFLPREAGCPHFINSPRKPWLGWRIGFDRADTTCRLTSFAADFTPVGAISKTSTGTE